MPEIGHGGRLWSTSSIALMERYGKIIADCIEANSCWYPSIARANSFKVSVAATLLGSIVSSPILQLSRYLPINYLIRKQSGPWTVSKAVPVGVLHLADGQGAPLVSLSVAMSGASSSPHLPCTSLLHHIPRNNEMLFPARCEVSSEPAASMPNICSLTPPPLTTSSSIFLSLAATSSSTSAGLEHLQPHILPGSMLSHAMPPPPTEPLPRLLSSAPTTSVWPWRHMTSLTAHGVISEASRSIAPNRCFSSSGSKSSSNSNNSNSSIVTPLDESSAADCAPVSCRSEATAASGGAAESSCTAHDAECHLASARSTTKNGNKQRSIRESDNGTDGGGDDGGISAAVGSRSSVDGVNSSVARGGGGRSVSQVPPEPRLSKPLRRMRDTSNLQDFAAAVQRHKARLSSDPLLLTTALTRLAQLADSASTSRGGGGGSGASGAAASTVTPVGGSAAVKAGQVAVTPLVSELLSQVPVAIPRMRAADLSSCVWAIGKLRPVWETCSETRSSAAQAVNAVNERLADEWQRHFASAPEAYGNNTSSTGSTSSSSNNVSHGSSSNDSTCPGSSSTDGSRDVRKDSKNSGAPGSGGEGRCPDSLHATAPNDATAASASAAAEVSSGEPLTLHKSSTQKDVDAVGTTTAPRGTADVTATSAGCSISGGGLSAVGSASPAHIRPLWSQVRPQDVASLAWGLARCLQDDGDVSTPPGHYNPLRLIMAPNSCTITTTATAPATATATATSTATATATASVNVNVSNEWVPVGATALPGALRQEASWHWLAAVAGDVLWSGQARDVAHLVWAFATVGRSGSEVFGNLMVALSDPRRGPALVSELREEECTAVLWAVSTVLERQRGRSITDAGGGATAFRESAALGITGGGVGPGLAKAVAHLGPRAAHLAMHGRLTGCQVSSMLRSLVMFKEAAGVDLDLDWLQALVVRAGHKARYMDGLALGDTAWALGKVRLPHEGTLRAVCSAALTALKHNSAASSGGGGAGDGRVVAEVSSPAVQRPDTRSGAGSRIGSGSGSFSVPHLPLRSLLQLLWACGRLQYTDKQLMEVAMARLAPEIPFLEPASLSTLSFALAALRCGHHPATFTAICKRAHQLLPPPPPPPSSSSSSSSSVAAALTSTPIPDTMCGPEEGPSMATSEALISEPRVNPSNTSSTEHLLELNHHHHHRQQQSQQMQGEGIRPSGSEDRPGPVVQGSPLLESSERLSTSQMAALMAALGRVEHYDSDLIDQLCDRLSSSELKELRARDVVSVVSALSQLEHPHTALMAAVERHVAADLTSYHSGQLIELLYGFATTGVRAERLLEEAARVMRKGVSALDAEAVARLAESYAVLGFPHDDLFQAIAVVAIRRPHLFSRDQVERVSRAFRSLGYEDSEELTEVWQHHQQRPRGGGYGRTLESISSKKLLAPQAHCPAALQT